MDVPEWQVSGTMACAQRSAILAALLSSSYNLTHAAQRLRIGRTTLYRLMKTYEIPFSIRRSRTCEEQEDHAAAARETSRVILVNGDWYLVGDGARARM